MSQSSRPPLYLVTSTMSLGTEDDTKIQELFDKTVGSHYDRLAKLIETNFAYGASLEQLTADRMRVCEPPAEVARLVEELVKSGILIRRIFMRTADAGTPNPEKVALFFHRTHRAKIEVTRVTFHLAEVA